MNLSKFFLFLVFVLSSSIFACLDNQLPLLCSDRIVCNNIKKMFPQTSLAKLCEESSFLLTTKYDGLIKELLLTSFVDSLSCKNKAIAASDTHLLQSFDDDLIRHINSINKYNNKKSTHKIITRDILWTKHQSDGIFASYLFDKFINKTNFDVTKLLAFFCFNWNKHGYIKKGNKKIKTKAFFDKQVNSKKETLELNRNKIKKKFYLTLKEHFEIFDVVSVYDKNVLHNCKTMYNLMCFEEQRYSDDKFLNKILDYFNKNKGINIFFADEVSEITKTIKDKINDMCVGIDYQAYIYTNQVNSFIKYLKHLGVNNYSTFADEVSVDKISLEKEMEGKYEIVKKNFPACYENFSEVLLASMLCESIEHKLALSKDAELKIIYKKFISNNKYTDIATNKAIDFSQDIDVLDAYTINKMINLNLESLYIFPDSYSKIAKKLPKEFSDYSYKYKIKYSNREKTRIAISRLSKKSNKQNNFVVYFDRSNKNLFQARMWFDSIQSSGDKKKINTYKLIHPLYANLFTMFDVYKDLGVYTGQDKNNQKCIKMQIFESDMMTFQSFSPIYLGVAKQIENINFTRCDIKNHTPIWKRIFMERYRECLAYGETVMKSLTLAYQYIVPSIKEVVCYYKGVKVDFTKREIKTYINSLIIEIFTMTWEEEFFIKSKNIVKDTQLLIKTKFEQYPMYLILDAMNLNYPINADCFEKIKAATFREDKDNKEIFLDVFLKLYKTHDFTQHSEIVKYIFTLNKNKSNKSSSLIYNDLWDKIRSSTAGKIKHELNDLLEVVESKEVFEKILKYFIWRLDYFVISMKENPRIIISAMKEVN